MPAFWDRRGCPDRMFGTVGPVGLGGCWLGADRVREITGGQRSLRDAVGGHTLLGGNTARRRDGDRPCRFHGDACSVGGGRRRVAPADPRPDAAGRGRGQRRRVRQGSRRRSARLLLWRLRCGRRRRSAIQQCADRYSTEHSDEPLDIRIGIAAGDVTVEDDDVFGVPVVEASRHLCERQRRSDCCGRPCACAEPRSRWAHVHTDWGARAEGLARAGQRV